MIREKIHRRIYVILLALLGGCMVTSVWASNLVWVLLGVNWLFEGRWREKWQMARSSRPLHLYLAFYTLCLIGMLWTSNLDFGLTMLQVKLPLLIVPLVVLTSKPLTGRARSVVLWIYSTTVIIVSIIGAIRLQVIDDLPYREAVPYISHIRFALNCCMVIFLLVSRIGKGRWHIARLLPVLWLVAFLVMIRSFTGFVVLAIVPIVMLLVYWRRVKARWLLLVLWTVAAVTGVLTLRSMVADYYRPVPLAEKPLAERTPNGNLYTHACDGIIENGNYVNNYVCHTELLSEWPRHSSVPIETPIDGGFTLEATLIRYLNALGLPKDSLGVTRLTPDQIAEIEQGVANPVYASGNPVRKMVYVLLFEREHMVHTHAVRGFTMLQRLELWKATLCSIERHLWIGSGTGDAVDDMHACLSDSGSDIADTSYRSHNQYLSILAMFGIVGAALILILALRAALGLRRQWPLMVAWLLTILISFLTEDTLDTLAGILFCTYFLAFRNPDKSSQKN